MATTTTIPAALITAAGIQVLSARIDMPLWGAWTAYLEIDADAPPAAGSPVEILIARPTPDSNVLPSPVVFEGTCLWGSFFSGRSQIEVVGGAGGLRTIIPAAAYSGAVIQTPLSSVISDILDLAGEKLATGVAASLAPYTVGNWSRAVGSAAAGLGRLCREFGLVWRVLCDGTIHVGPAGFPAVMWNATTPGNPYIGTSTPAPLAVLPPFVNDPGDEGNNRVVTTAPEQATLLPSTTVLGKQVIRVVYNLDSSGALRGDLYYQGPDGRTDRDDWERAVRTVLPELPHLASYSAMITAVRAHGLVEVRCDDTTIGEVDNVILLAATPETAITPTAGQRVRLFFASGDPTSYYAVGFEQDPTATAKVARVGDRVNCGSLTATAPPSGGPVQFTYTGPDGIPVGPSPTVDLSGLISSGHPRIALTTAS
jgi:hypothetical protein